MDSSFWFDTINLGWSIVHIYNVGVSGYNFQKILYSFVRRYFFTFTNSVDPGEMPHDVAFHSGLHCLQKYSFMGFPNTKG